MVTVFSLALLPHKHVPTGRRSSSARRSPALTAFPASSLYPAQSSLSLSETGICSLNGAERQLLMETCDPNSFPLTVSVHMTYFCFIPLPQHGEFLQKYETHSVLQHQSHQQRIHLYLFLREQTQNLAATEPSF